MKSQRSKLAVILIVALSISALLLVWALMRAWSAGASIVRTDEPSRVISALDQQANEVRSSIANAAMPENSYAIWMDFTHRADDVLKIEPADEMQLADWAKLSPKLTQSRDTVRRAADMLKGGQNTSAVVSARGMVLQAVSSIEKELSETKRGMDAGRASATRDLMVSIFILAIAMLLCLVLVMMLLFDFFWRQRRTSLITTTTTTTTSFAPAASAAETLPAASPTLQALAPQTLVAAPPAGESSGFSEDLANRRLKIALDESPLAVVEWSPDHTITRWAGRAEEMFGWRADEIVGHAWSHINHLHPDDKDMVVQEVRQLTEGKTNRKVIAHRNLHKDGRTLHIVWYNSVIRRPDGSIETFLSLAEDVTARVHAEQQSTKQSSTLRRISEVAPVGLCMMDPAGQVVTANPRHYEIFTGTPKIIDGPALSCGDVKLFDLDGTEVPKEQWPPALALRDGQLIRDQVYRVESAGLKELRYVSVSATPLFDQQGKIETALVVSSDVTERMTEELRREQLQAELSQARRMEAVGTFSAGVAHDLGNSLLAVDAAADNLVNASRTGRDVSEARSSLSAATTATRAMSRGLVDYASADTAKATIELVQWLPDATKFCSWLMPDGVKLNVDTQVQQAHVNASRGQLKRLLMNLVLNARDAIGQRGQIDVVLKQRPPLLDKPEAPLGFVELSVRDNGQGMSEATRRRVFERFFTTKAQGKGSGIGMATVADIVRDHDGTVEIDSALGQGTTVRVLLPLREAPAPAVALPATPPPSAPPAATAARIDQPPFVLPMPQQPTVITPAAISVSPAASWPPALPPVLPPATEAVPAAAPAAPQPALPLPAAIMLVAPDGPSRPLLVQNLRNAGSQVMVMNDAEAAWAYARNNGHGPLPLVIFDLQSPGLDGLSLLRRLRTVDASAKMLLLGDDEDELDLDGTPGTDLLVRPFTMATVRAAAARMG
jgi:PAS domain S-box-containing protein